ncbi:MAG TPA: hypothetical protein GX526_06460, partial [Thermoanaerobacterales bacterium]|nr:hypothetical protein [Thermoanaerobacterales bacterium]
LYDRPEDINIFELFYNGSGLEEIITEQERMDIIEYNGWEMEPDCSCTKISKTNMDKILFKYIELGLEETEKIGIENFTYLNEYDAFYYYHGDTNYLTKITFSEGTRTDNIICLYYNDDFVGDGEKVLTLKAQEGNYVFLSNKKVEK